MIWTFSLFLSFPSISLHCIGSNALAVAIAKLSIIRTTTCIWVNVCCSRSSCWYWWQLTTATIATRAKKRFMRSKRKHKYPNLTKTDLLVLGYEPRENNPNMYAYTNKSIWFILEDGYASLWVDKYSASHHVSHTMLSYYYYYYY